MENANLTIKDEIKDLDDMSSDVHLPANPIRDLSPIQNNTLESRILHSFSAVIMDTLQNMKFQQDANFVIRQQGTSDAHPFVPKLSPVAQVDRSGVLDHKIHKKPSRVMDPKDRRDKSTQLIQYYLQLRDASTNTDQGIRAGVLGKPGLCLLCRKATRRQFNGTEDLGGVRNFQMLASANNQKEKDNKEPKHKSSEN